MSLFPFLTQNLLLWAHIAFSERVYLDLTQAQKKKKKSPHNAEDNSASSLRKA